jgi:hypothetical protein
MLVQWVLSRPMLRYYVDFVIIYVKHEVHSILAFNHKHKCCSNRDHKKTHHAQEHKMYPGKPFSTREENPTKSFAIILKRRTFTTKIKPSTQESAQTLED